MKETKVNIEPLSLAFHVVGNNWHITIPKSKTNIQYPEQLKLLTKQSNKFVQLEYAEKEDVYELTYTMDKRYIHFQTLKDFPENEKLRALSNLYSLFELLGSRFTCFLHPNNVVFDENLMPLIIHRGIKGLLEPFEITEMDFLTQYKCFAIALFSKELTFDHLYNGFLTKTNKTTFEKGVNEQQSVEQLAAFLQNNFLKEQQRTEKTMQLVPVRKYKLFRNGAVSLSIFAALLLGLIVYTAFVKIPYQERLLKANEQFIGSEYSEVIRTLQYENYEKLPHSTKYILAYSFVRVEPISEREEETILKNIHLNSDNYYLLYWIYNGSGDFDRSIDIAKYIDDPQLIIYGLIKKTEQVKHDPSLTGEERELEVRALRDELEKYTEEYDLYDESEEIGDVNESEENTSADDLLDPVGTPEEAEEEEQTEEYENKPDEEETSTNETKKKD